MLIFHIYRLNLYSGIRLFDRVTDKLLNFCPVCAETDAGRVSSPPSERSLIFKPALCTVFLYCKNCIIIIITIIPIPGWSRREARVISFFGLPCQISDENILLYFQSFDKNKRMIINQESRASFFVLFVSHDYQKSHSNNQERSVNQ